MAQKKDTPASTQPKESKKTTSRRTFGKQLTGALAVLPIAGMISTPGVSALASELSSDAKRPAIKPPASGIWNGSERYRAIEPALPTALRYDAQFQGVLLPQAAKTEVAGAISAAAKASGATESQITQWLEAYIQLGKPGLFAEIEVEGGDCAAALNGTWELTSRFSGGAEIPTRSRIYNDMDPAKGTGKQLITMVTEVNLVEAPPTTIFYMGFADLQFRQNGPYEVVVTANGTIFGNTPGYEDGLKTTDVFRLVRKGQNETMIGYPERTQSNDDGINVTRTLVEVGGDPGTIKYKMWGVPATKSQPRTMDTVDTYTVMGNRRPLIGGWEPIQDHFDRVARQGFSSLKFPNREALRRACEFVSIPHGTRE
jgi:hypothetical protein